MADTIILLDTSIDVISKQRELVSEALGANSIYIRMKETLESLFDEGAMKNPEIASVVSGTIATLANSITSQSMSIALQWATQEKEFEIQKLQVSSKLALESEVIKASYVDRVAKDKQTALIGLDTVVKFSNVLPEGVYTPKYEV